MSRTFTQDNWALVVLEDEDGQISTGAAGPCLIALIHARSAQQAFFLHLSPISAYQHPDTFRGCLDEAAAGLPREVEVWIGGCAPNGAADHLLLRAEVRNEVLSRWPAARLELRWVDDANTFIEFELDVESNEVQSI